MATVKSQDIDSNECNDTIFHQLESYPFSTDTEFQSGLSTILSSTSSQDPELLTLRARCFYFSRKRSVPIDFHSYILWRSLQSLRPVVAGSQDTPPSEAQRTGIPADNGIQEASAVRQPEQRPEAPYPSSFAKIVNLITKGEPIPGIKEVPDTLLTGQESAANSAKRRKPWERDEAVAEAPEPI
ncbi:MAG: hypothetical protein LQ346_000814 [Caloplaca aetnensis]|nr:MAG: hypothetical protein LQ346_000814 [Caloplaca aetnensis]